MYYLQSRYYDPEIGRFINADDVSALGADGTPLSYNLFAYCKNNPVNGSDPTGMWDWGGVLIGVGIVAATVITVATGGVGTIAGAVVASAFIATGTAITCAAATDSTMVLDLSYSTPNIGPLYGKAGASVVVDFKQDEINLYGHAGFGVGYSGSGGLSYSTGPVSNYNNPEDYSRDFVGGNANFLLGFDHCWNPKADYKTATKATSVSFSTSASAGVEYSYYSPAWLMTSW